MLSELQLRNFRGFEALALELEPGFNFFLGRNGVGKTSILEAACVLLRLQSQRSSSLAPLVRIGHKSFALAGRCLDHLLEFQYQTFRRAIALGGVLQKNAAEYLQLARVVSFATTDIELARGSAEARRRYLDFIGAQIDPTYRATLRAYERALRSRNALLKSPQPRLREIAAYDLPLLEHGKNLSRLRSEIVSRIAPQAAEAHRGISGVAEKIEIKFLPGSGEDFEKELQDARAEELRLRQTTVGPHRDDLEIVIEGKRASLYASEGQQRTLALALKIAQATIFKIEMDAPPLLLIDDIFGELDPERRNALLKWLPAGSQKLVTATTLEWQRDDFAAALFKIDDGQIRRS